MTNDDTGAIHKAHVRLDAQSSGALPASKICMTALDQLYAKLSQIEQSLNQKMDDIRLIKESA